MGINKKGAALALVIVAFMILIGLGSSSEMDRASDGSAGSSIDQKPTLKPTLDNMDMQLDCKNPSDLQEFYACVNNP